MITTNKSKSAPPQPTAASQPAVEIRLFPYPYKAALAISNDLDGITTFKELKAIHDVLNGERKTPCGPGLGLEVGESLHFYTVHPEVDDTLSYFQGTSNQLSETAPALRDGIEAGLIDTLHTWGNFSQKGGFFREHAQGALEELERYGLTIPCWTNHGDVHNFQNLGRKDALGDLPATASVRGDRSKVLEYHFDLTRRAGVRYIWIKELTPIPGQERPLEPADWLEEGTTLGRSVLKDIMKRLRGTGDAQPPQLANRLLQPATFRDGATAYEMLRFGSFEQDGSDHLPALLSDKNLKRLIQGGGTALLYMHLGKGRPSQEIPFSDESYAALSRLAKHSREGDIWITTPSRLCNYVELRQRLKLRASLDKSIANVTGRFDAVGDLSNPDIGGLTFYLDQAKECWLQLGTRKKQLVQNLADHTGRGSFSIPIEPLQYCW